MSERRRRVEAAGALAGLAASLVALALAPLLMPASYSWRTNTISESAAQGIEDAWLARLGLALFGLSALWVVRIAGLRWGLLARLCFVAFGALMTAVASVATRPWEPDLPYDRTEDLLHSLAATGVGAAFIAGAILVAFQHGFGQPPRVVDLGVAALACLLTLGMSFLPDYDGLLQRVMFLTAYAWFAREVLYAAGWLGPEHSHPGAAAKPKAQQP